MPFVKLDTGMLRSTIWFEREQREMFITALLMAEPRELREPMPQLEVRTLTTTGFVVPPGWYGFVEAAGVGIGAQAQVEREAALTALEALGAPEGDSRSQSFEGRRLVRVNGGYVVLNYMHYREKDYTNAERCRRYRQLKQTRAATAATAATDTPTRRVVTQPTRETVLTTRDTSHPTVSNMQAEAEAEEERTRTPLPPLQGGVTRDALDVAFECVWARYPNKRAKKTARKRWHVLKPSNTLQATIAAHVEAMRDTDDWTKDAGRFVPHFATYLNNARWDDPVPKTRDDDENDFTPRELFAARDYRRKQGGCPHDDDVKRDPAHTHDVCIADIAWFQRKQRRGQA